MHTHTLPSRHRQPHLPQARPLEPGDKVTCILGNVADRRITPELEVLDVDHTRGTFLAGIDSDRPETFEVFHMRSIHRVVLRLPCGTLVRTAIDETNERLYAHRREFEGLLSRSFIRSEERAKAQAATGEGELGPEDNVTPKQQYHPWRPNTRRSPHS